MHGYVTDCIISLLSCKNPTFSFSIAAYQQNQQVDPYAAGQSPVHANPENTMSNLSAFMMQGPNSIENFGLEFWLEKQLEVPF